MDKLNEIIVELVDIQELDWSSVYSIVQADFPELSQPAIRGRYYRHSSHHEATSPTIRGVTVGESTSADRAIERAKEEWRQQLILRERKKRQSVEFDSGPICIVFIADAHAGSAGVNYDRLFADGDIIAATPRMYASLLGDFVDQFVLGNLRNIRFHSRLSIPEEWAIARGFLDLIAHKVIVSVAGNHENWSNQLIGVDYFRDVMSRVREDVLYDVHAAAFKLKVGSAEWRVKVRHKWRGTSALNPTYGIEKASLYDQDFDVGVGAHTHVSGLARQFNNAGSTGWAIICGSYKEEDDYADMLGVPKPNTTACVPIVFMPGGTCMAFETLADAASYMRMAWVQKSWQGKNDEAN